MKERPILFSGPMVRAILSGAKTQTRRIGNVPGCDIRDSPYHKGMRLWVREAWNFLGTDMMRHGRTHSTQDGVVKYLADGERRTINTKWRNVEVWMARKPQSRPSIHMPRWASRLTLEITGVRVERLQDISEADAWAEGVAHYSSGMTGTPSAGDADAGRVLYRRLWESINGPGSWEANPWVWVVEFRRIGQCAREVCWSDEQIDGLRCRTVAQMLIEENATRAEMSLRKLYAAPPVPRVDPEWLANVIRTVDGNHTMGTGALAEKIAEAINGRAK